MKKVKDFFDKKSKDIKFSTAGTGHKLSDPPRSGQPSTSKAANPAVPASASSSAEPYSNRRTGPDPNVAAAVLARFEGKGGATNVPPAKPTLHNIMEEEKRKAIEEIRQKEREEVWLFVFELLNLITNLLYLYLFLGPSKRTGEVAPD